MLFRSAVFRETPPGSNYSLSSELSIWRHLRFDATTAKRTSRAFPATGRLSYEDTRRIGPRRIESGQSGFTEEVTGELVSGLI